MPDPIILSIKVDTADIERATAALERLAQAGDEARISLQRLVGNDPESLGQAISRVALQTIERERRPGGVLHSELPIGGLPEVPEADRPPTI